MDYTLRTATPADLDRLVELLGQLFAGEQEFSPDPAKQRAGLALILGDAALGKIYVLEADGRVLGTVSLLRSASTYLGGPAAWLEDMIVDQAYRNAGLGSALIDYALEQARQDGYLRVSLLTDSTNTGAQRYYQRKGFVFSPMVPMRLVF